MGSSGSQFFEEFEVGDIFCGSTMGLTSSSSNPKGRRVIESKLETATKTGVLNLADMVRKIWFSSEMTLFDLHQ